MSACREIAVSVNSDFVHLQYLHIPKFLINTAYEFKKSLYEMLKSIFL